MPTTVPRASSLAQLRRLVVGAPVSSAHGLHWAAELAFQMGAPVHHVYSGHLAATTTASTVYVPYARSPGAQLIRVTAELHPTAADARVTATLSLTNGLTLPGDHFDGTNAHTAPLTSAVGRPELKGYMSVAAVTVGAIQDLAVTWAVSSGTPQGWYRICVTEVPLADLNPGYSPTTERGLNSAWPLPPNRLVDGSASTSHGFARLWAEMHTARTEMRRHWALATPELDATAWTSTSAGGAELAWTGQTGSHNNRWKLRARRLGSSSTTNNYTLKARYRVQGGGTGTIDVTIDGTTYSLTGLTSATYASAASAAGAVTLATNNADQECTISKIEGSVSGGGTIYVSQVALIEHHLTP